MSVVGLGNRKRSGRASWIRGGCRDWASRWWETLSHSTCRQDPKVHHRVHKSQPLVPILSQLNPLHTAQPISPRSILIPSSHLRLALSSGLFPSSFPPKPCYTFISSPMRATCPAHLILLGLVCLTSTNYEAPHCATFSFLLFLHSS
jgi:hypothetical protein